MRKKAKKTIQEAREERRVRVRANLDQGQNREIRREARRVGEGLSKFLAVAALQRVRRLRAGRKKS